MADASLAPVMTTNARTAHVALALLALAMGGFAIGTTEFVTMGLLPDIAAGHRPLDRRRTGHVISAYAFGVVVGAPVIVVARRPAAEAGAAGRPDGCVGVGNA